MIRQLKAEFQKMFTIRSTYVILVIGLLIAVLFAFYIEAFKLSTAVTDPGKLAGEVRSALNSLIFLITLVGVLLVTHEYRYSTINYTLTASNKRLKVFFAKVIAVTCFTIIVAAFFGVLAPLLTYAGIHLKGLSMVQQHFQVWDLVWRGLCFAWGYAMLGLALTFIIRNQVGAIVTLLFFPGTVEALLGLLLKNNSGYLPFTALGTVLGAHAGPELYKTFSAGKSAVIVAVYIVIAFIVSAYLFQKRDAS